MKPAVVIHGGAGRRFDDAERRVAVQESLRGIVAALDTMLRSGAAADEVVVAGCELLEDDPLFNAGLGSAIQSDGSVRLTAALMTPGCFSAVVNVEEVQHPIVIAAFLQSQPDRVIAGDGAQRLARELGLPVVDLRTERRLAEWAKRAQKRSDVAVDVAAPDDRHGTIGVVVLDQLGALAVGTSTGGRGFERVGRVSDVASPCGNYCDTNAAVSATGIGEDIVDAALASSIVVRAESATLRSATQSAMSSAAERGHEYGTIAIDHAGTIVIGKTTQIMLAAYASDDGVGDTVAWEDGLHVWSSR